MSSGALTPHAAVTSTYHDALHHLDEPAQLAFFKNFAGGLQIGLSGLTSMIIAGGCPSLKSSNPGLVHFLEGAIFSTGLITVYFTGAELFTGYPMWLAIAALKRKRRVRQYLVAIVTSLVGNFLGALMVAALFGVAAAAVSEEPSRSYIVGLIESSIVESGWEVIFVKSIACGYLVTLAMLLGTQNQDGISKALALWLPFALATSAEFPHTVKFMHLGPLGMMLGAPMSVGQYVYKCLLPIILGNFIGGAVFTGAYHWWVFLQCNNGERKTGTTFSETIEGYQDEDED